MKYMNPLLGLRRRPLEVPVPEATQTESEKHTKENGSVHGQQEVSDVDSDDILADAQPGVQKMEATTKTWSMASLITAYVLLVAEHIDAILDGADHKTGSGSSPLSTPCNRAWAGH
jgi:hypothetical protein